MNRKGITPVVAIVLLLIIAVAVVGIAYGFITGFFEATTGTAAIVSGLSSCNAGNTNIVITNAGTDSIDVTDVTIIVKTGSTAVWGVDWNVNAFPIAIGTSGVVAENTTNNCGVGIDCTYDVAIGGVLFPTRANC